MIYEHLTYLDLSPEQIQNALPLETTGDTLTNYYMIPVDDLPLLDPLRLIPVVDNPLADLLQPDMQVLVDLGYGGITDGWSQGPANAPTPFELFPSDINWGEAATALPQLRAFPRRSGAGATPRRAFPIRRFPTVTVSLHGGSARGTPDAARLRENHQ